MKNKVSAKEAGNLKKLILVQAREGVKAAVAGDTWKRMAAGVNFQHNLASLADIYARKRAG